MLKKNLKKVIIFTLLITILISSTCLAATPKLINNLEKNLNTIKEWIIKISTPAAAVAIGVGILMKKFSFGDEERIRIGKKIIKSSLFSYAFILAIDLILSAIKSLIS